ncbi:MAG: hypothetical protein U0903_18305 [Planctomycetales bacterium]
MGTFAELAPPYHTRLVERLYEHAENQYLETMMEMGICGVVLLVSAIALMYWSWRRLSEMVVADEYGETLAMVICGAYVLLSQVICSLFDYRGIDAREHGVTGMPERRDLRPPDVADVHKIWTELHASRDLVAAGDAAGRGSGNRRCVGMV